MYYDKICISYVNNVLIQLTDHLTFIHLFIYSFIHSFIHSFIRSVIQFYIRSFKYSVTQFPIEPFSGNTTHSKKPHVRTYRFEMSLLMFLYDEAVPIIRVMALNTG